MIKLLNHTFRINKYIEYNSTLVVCQMVDILNEIFIFIGKNLYYQLMVFAHQYFFDVGFSKLYLHYKYFQYQLGEKIEMQRMSYQMRSEYVQSLKLQLQQAQNDIKFKDIQLISKANIIKSLQQQVEELNSKLKSIQPKLQQFTESSRSIPNLDSQLNSYKLESQAKDALIAESKANILVYAQRVSKLTAQVANLIQRLKKIEDQLASKNTLIQKLRQSSHEISDNNSLLQSAQGVVPQVNDLNPQQEDSEDNDQDGEVHFLNNHKKKFKQLDGYCVDITNSKQKIRFLNILMAFAESRLDQIGEIILDTE